VINKKGDKMSRKVYLIGIGMGNEDGLSVEAQKRIKEADLLIGAQRMLDVLKNDSSSHLVSYQAKEIGVYLRMHPEFLSPCVLLSGDVGFYSGASKLLKELTDFEVELLPGISSLSAFCAKLNISWEDIFFTSCHGRKQNLIYPICHRKKTFALLSNEQDIPMLCKKLMDYQISEVILHIGERLSYPDEKILHLSPDEAEKRSYHSPLVLLAENAAPRLEYRGEIADSEFVRGEVPMTKSEVRTIGLSKLKLTKEACFYDIGAGTGSISIQAAMNFPDSQIYSIERKEQAISLIEENKRRFAADNVTVIKGIAPECIEGLLPPSHVLIGGSMGKMREILEAIWRKNADARIVVHAICPETVGETLQILKEKGREVEELLQIGVAKGKKVGSYHLMTGQNPVTILVF